MISRFVVQLGVICLLLGAMTVWALCQPPAPVEPAASSAPANTGHSQKISLWQAIQLGAVEGLTEYLPVSSTGHLILASHSMGLTHFSNQRGPMGPKIVQTPAINAFEVVIQFGAILAVVGLYRRRIAQMFDGLLGRNPQGLRLLALLAVAFLPSAIVGLALQHRIKEYLFSPFSVCLALVVGGVAMIAVERWWLWRKKTQPAKTLGVIDAMSFRQALIIGFAQCLALWPGTSRSMITIVAALLVGLDMVSSAEFSFLLALPTLSAATLYETYKEGGAIVHAAGVDGLIAGLVVSGIVAALAVKGLVAWLTRHGLTPFGVYRILLAGVVLYLLR